MSQLKLFIKFIMRTAFSKCPKCQTYTVFVFVTYTHKRVFDLSLSRLLSDYFTVGLITGRYTSTYFLSIKFQHADSVFLYLWGWFWSFSSPSSIVYNQHKTLFAIFQKSKDLYISLHISVLNNSFKIDTNS
jgi:hypothetical protein